MGIRRYRIHKTVPVMNMLLNRIVFVGVVITAFLFFSCEEKLEQPNLLLNENEMCFNEKLISITPNGSDYYIGTESSGRIYVYSSEMSNIDTLYTECGRIYHVYRINEDYFYVGTQNMGLKKMQKKGKKLIEESSYLIKGKDKRYSCYEVYIDDANTYAMTSHGIYKVVQSDTLYPVYDHVVDIMPEPFVASNMVKLDGCLFAATARGLIKIKNDDTKECLPQNIRNIESHDGYVYALSNVLYKINSEGASVDSFLLKASADYYYYADSINYFLSGNQLTLVHDTALQSLKEKSDHTKRLEHYKTVNTRRNLSVEGHHVIADSKNYSLLVADNALWLVGHHLPSVFGELKEGGARLTCKDTNNLFSLVGKKVYKLGPNNIAKEVLELKDGGEVNLMECSPDGQYLYYVKNKNEVWRQEFNTPWYYFGQKKPEKIGTTPKEITAMCFHESLCDSVILGIRDGLICMDKDGHNTIIKLFTNSDNYEVDSIPYIRRFAKGKDGYYVPTMNEGLFYGEGKNLYIVDSTENFQFIRDVACSDSSNSLYILTNRHLFMGKDSVIDNSNRHLFMGKDSVIDNSNFGSRLLVSGNMIYIPGEVGGVRVIQLGKNNKIMTDSIRFPDVSFRAESSWVLDGIVYLGGQSGIIALNSKNGNSNYVQFEDNSPFPYLLLLLVLSIVGIIISFVLFLREKSITIHWKRFHKESISSKMGWLKAVRYLLDDSYKSRIDKMENKLEKLHKIDRTEKKEKRKEISTDIDRLIREVSFVLKDILSDLKNQYKELAIFNGSKMEEVDETESINMKSTIDLYNERIRDEIRIKTYKLIFEEKRDICYSPITYKLKRIKAIRGILDKKESTSKCKLKDLDKELSEHQKEILEDITNHLVSNSMNIEEISNDGDDERIIKRLKGTFEELHKSAQSLTGLNASALFKLIKKVTIADGRLEMVRQIIEIRKIVNAKHINEDDKKRLEKVIFQFYSPALAYDIDMDVYDSLLKCTENVSNPPKGLKGGPNHVQQPFFILAVAMAKKDKLKLEKSKNENPQNYVYYFPQKPKRSNKEDPNSTIFVKPDSSSISRAKGFVTSWVNSDFTKSLKTQVDDSSSSLYVSVSAYYLTALL